MIKFKIQYKISDFKGRVKGRTRFRMCFPKIGEISLHLGLCCLVGIILLSNFLINSQVVAASDINNISFLDSAQEVLLTDEDKEMIVDLTKKMVPFVKETNIDFATNSALNISEEGHIVSPHPAYTDFYAGRHTITYYTVKKGDTLTKLAKKFKISVNTIKWANNLNTDLLKPGKKLLILPVDGVYYKIERGDTLWALVNKYKADFQKTKKWNNLENTDSLQIGQKIILVNGQIPLQSPSISTSIPITSNNRVPNYSYNYSYRPAQPRTWSNYFPYGWCTWWVAQKRYVPWRGNAGWWFYNAQRMGYAVGYHPRVGAIAVWRGGWGGLGHVAYVEWVKPDGSFGISEMNYLGWGRVSYRSFRSIQGTGIYGFIY